MVIGNAGGGKTTLSRRLGEIYKLPMIHVDSIQFIPNMKIRALDETREILNRAVAQENWLIDGFGPLDLIEKRFAIADKIIFIDLPLWRHTWWCVKRQIKSIWSRRAELPEGCNEATIGHTIKLFQTLWRVHTQMRPELIRILNRESLRHKVISIRNLKEWNELAGAPRQQ
jgi:adenylate kinase family enzyme